MLHVLKRTVCSFMVINHNERQENSILRTKILLNWIYGLCSNPSLFDLLFEFILHNEIPLHFANISSYFLSIFSLITGQSYLDSL